MQKNLICILSGELVLVMTFLFNGNGVAFGVQNDPVLAEQEVTTHPVLTAEEVTLETHSLERWNKKLDDLVESRRTSFHPYDVLELLQDITTLKESDGAIYYYTHGRIHDQLSRASKEYRLANHLKAIENYTNAIGQNDSVAMFYYARGRIKYFHAVIDDTPEFHDKALEDYKIAEQLDPKWAVPVDAQGWYHVRKKEYDKAIPLFERALNLNENCRDAMIGLVQIFDDQLTRTPNDTEIIKKSLDYLKRIVLISDLENDTEQGRPINVTVHSVKLIALLKQQEDISIETHPEYYNDHDFQLEGVRLARLKKYDEAIKCFTKILEGPSSPYLRYRNTTTYVPTFRSLILLERIKAYCAIQEWEKAEKDSQAYIDETVGTPDRRKGYFSYDFMQCYFHVLCKLGKKDGIVEFYRENKDALSETDVHARNLFIDIALAMAEKNGEESNREFLALMQKYQDKLVGNIRGSYVRHDPDAIQLLGIYCGRCYQEALKEPDFDRRDMRSVKMPYRRLGPDFSGRYSERCENMIPLLVECDISKVFLYKKLGDLFASKQNYGLATIYYETYLSYEPADEQALYALLGCVEIYDSQNSDKIYGVITRLVAVNPEVYDYWIERSQYSNRDGQKTRIYDLTKALELYQKQTVTAKDDHTLLKLLMWRAKASRSEDAILQAYHDYKQIFENLKNTTTDVSNLKFEDLYNDHNKSLFYQEYVEFLLSHSYNAEIIAEYDTLIAKGADERFLTAARGKAYYGTNQHQKSLDDFKLIIEFGISPLSKSLKSENIYAMITHSYRCLEQYDQAIEFLTNEIEKQPKNAALYRCRADAYENRSRKSGATQEERERDSQRAKEDRERKFE